MAEHGGYRKPANPAPISGPGKYSKRTDGQVMSSIPGQDYGQKTADLNTQRTAPMAGQKPVPTPPTPQPAQVSHPTPYQGGDFGAPTANPAEPVTAGAPAGPGPGPEVLGGAPSAGEPGAMPTGYVTSILQQLAPGDVHGTLADLLVMARQRGV